MNRLLLLNERYKEVKKKWDDALESNDGEKIAAIEEDFFNASDALTTAFLTKMKIESNPAEYKKILSISHTEEFLNIVEKYIK